MLTVALLVAVGEAVAQPRPGERPLHARATLAPVTVRGAGTAMLLTMTVDPGWHISWRNPGETGLPTRFTWSLPTGVQVARVTWPVPLVGRTPVGVQHTLEGDVPWVVEFGDGGPPGSDRLVSVTIRYGVCRDVCIPEQQVVQGVLPDARDQAPVLTAAVRSRLAFTTGAVLARIDGDALCFRAPAGLTAGAPLALVGESAATGEAALAVTRRGPVLIVRLPAGVRPGQGAEVVLAAGERGQALTLDFRPQAPRCAGTAGRR